MAVNAAVAQPDFDDFAATLTRNRPPTGEIRKCAGDGPDGIMRKRSPQTASLRLSLPMRKLPSPQASSRKRKSVCSVSTVTRFGMAITSRNWRTPRREPTPSMGVSILRIHRARATDSMTSRNRGSGKNNAAVKPQKNCTIVKNRKKTCETTLSFHRFLEEWEIVFTLLP